MIYGQKIDQTTIYILEAFIDVSGKYPIFTSMKRHYNIKLIFLKNLKFEMFQIAPLFKE